MTFALAGVVFLAIGLPHVMDLDRADPTFAVAIWFSTLVLRALAAFFAVLFVVAVLPATQLFTSLTHWCWHGVLPVVTAHLGLDGRAFGDAAVVAPALFLAGSAVAVCVGLVRTARSLGAVLRRSSLGRGPGDSVIVGGSGVLVAAAGVARPQVVVSAGALTVLDDAELTAGLDHERGHIARGHRFVLVLAAICRALGRFVPGGARAMAELTFHLERDADRWAISRRNDPLALASAICKAATPETPTAAAPLLTELGGGGATRRVVQLIELGERPAGRRSRGTAALAVGMVALALMLSALAPAAAFAALERPDAKTPVRHCER